MSEDGYRNNPDPVTKAGDCLGQEEPQKVAVPEQGQVAELFLGAEDTEVRALWCWLDVSLLVRRVPHIVKNHDDVGAEAYRPGRLRRAETGVRRRDVASS